jgi:PTH1 family peptidyl-tRNA hydrolase
VKFIIGLGNPGIEYKLTKHNIGFEVVKKLAKINDVKISQKLHFSLLGRGKIHDQDVTLVLPQTYMNLAGHAVGELLNREIKDIGDLVVVCDDVNIELGRIRLRKQGSSGGQKGLESIIRTIGRDDFPRLRVGIATEIHRGDITNYVLSPFKRKEKRHVAHSISLACDTIDFMIKNGVDKAMSRFNKIRAGTS